jgi:hypothetical protein
MVVTAATVIKNVRTSRRWKAELVAYKICIQPLPRFMYLLPLKPDHSLLCPVCPKSLQHPLLISKSHSYQTVHWNLFLTTVVLSRSVFSSFADAQNSVSSRPLVR